MLLSKLREERRFNLTFDVVLRLSVGLGTNDLRSNKNSLIHVLARMCLHILTWTWAFELDLLLIDFELISCKDLTFFRMKLLLLFPYSNSSLTIEDKHE